MFKLLVLLSIVAYAAAQAGYVNPLAYSAGLPYGYSGLYQGYAPSAYSTFASQPHNYPAVFLDPVNGVPLDTPEVVAARAAHYEAKALSGVHFLKKRSVVAPLAYTESAVAPVVTPLDYSSWASPYAYNAYTSPVAYSAAYPKAYSVHSW